jgi:hypothetical protein
MQQVNVTFRYAGEFVRNAINGALPFAKLWTGADAREYGAQCAGVGDVVVSGTPAGTGGAVNHNLFGSGINFRTTVGSLAPGSARTVFTNNTIAGGFAYGGAWVTYLNAPPDNHLPPSAQNPYSTGSLKTQLLQQPLHVNISLTFLNASLDGNGVTATPLSPASVGALNLTGQYATGAGGGGVALLRMSVPHAGKAGVPGRGRLSRILVVF